MEADDSRRPGAIQQTLRKLGADIRTARRKRGIAIAVMASRVMVSRVTWYKIERGDPMVSMGSYAAALYVLGMLDRLSSLADPGTDPVGLALDEERLPKAIRTKKVI